MWRRHPCCSISPTFIFQGQPILRHFRLSRRICHQNFQIGTPCLWFFIVFAWPAAWVSAGQILGINTYDGQDTVCCILLAIRSKSFHNNPMPFGQIFCLFCDRPLNLLLESLEHRYCIIEPANKLWRAFHCWRQYGRQSTSYADL